MARKVTIKLQSFVYMKLGTSGTNELSLKRIWFCIPIEMASFYGEAGEGVSRERQFPYTRKNARSVKYPTSLTGDK